MSIDEFAANHVDGLHRFAYLLTRDSDKSADLTQGVLAQLTARGLDGLNDPAAYARACLINLHRRAQRRAALRIRERIAASADRTGVDPHQQIDDRDAIWRALATLSTRQRAAIVLRFYEDLSDPQIARILGCTSATVRSLLSRGRTRLRRELDETDTSPGREELS